jgi:nucleoside-diphosphate-sugar epimerase
MKVFVAGASRAVGRRMILRLLAAGHAVVAMTRDRAKDALGWKPRFPSWREGFAASLSAQG